MNAHSAALHSMQDAGFFGVPAMARMFSGTVAGLSTIAAYAPVTYHEVRRVCNNLNGLVAALEPQIALIEQLTERIHCRGEIVSGHYLDDASGSGIAENENITDNLRHLLDDLIKSEQSVVLDPDINASQRQQLHFAHQHAIALAHRGIAAVERLTGVIITHDLDAEPPPAQVWDNLEDMLTALKAQPA